MKIIGISGIDGAARFKRQHWPGLDEREYRIAQGYDSAAALVVDGDVVACVAEERLTREKHTGAFPVEAIGCCLEIAGLAIGEIDELAHGFDYRPYRKLFELDPISRQLYTEVYSPEALAALVAQHLPAFPADRVRHVDHHLAHAASAYFTSGWDECLVVAVDAMGEAHGASVYRARGGALQLIRAISAHDSIGILYSLVTLHLGFEFNSDEYKVMGLAPYGDPERFRSFFDGAVDVDDAGNIHISLLRLNRDRAARETYAASRANLAEKLIPARHPDDEITRDHEDVAAALQECLDRTMVALCGSLAAETGLRRLALAGGVALNCTANGRLLQSGRFDDIYIQPAAGDDGVALGAALSRAAAGGEIKNSRMRVPFLGPRAQPGAVEEALAAFGERIGSTRLGTLEDACAEAARLIAAGKVIAWYRGRMEYGPRALGNRSILADPGHPEMRDRINAMVKMREAFRPFAPAVTIEEVHRWFDVPAGTELPYMIVVVETRAERRHELPAITHVDGTARVQTVSGEDNPDFHRLLCAVGETTGRELVLNTSFNVKGQPIVNTPAEAIETFLGTGIEFLFLENTLITKRA